MTAISADTSLPARFNMLGAALVFKDLPFSNQNLAINLLGDFVNRSLASRATFEQVTIPRADCPVGDWDSYFDHNNASRDRCYYVVSSSGELRLAPQTIDILRERLRDLRAYNLL